LDIWVFRLLGAIALAISLMAGADTSPLLDPDPLTAELAVGAMDTAVEAPIPLGSLDPESITAPATIDPEHPLCGPDIALRPAGCLPTPRAPPRRPPRLAS